MTRLKRTSLTDQATEAIIGLIRERGLRDGETLPPTAEMAAMFDVSVPVIREATAGLVAIGLLNRKQGRESTVSTPDSTHLARLLSLRIASIEVDDESIQQYREIMEVGSARLAARNRHEESLGHLEEALSVLRAADTPDLLHAADVGFHSAVARAAGNDLFELTLDALEPLLRRQRQRVWNGWASSGGDLDSIIEAHAIILDAIRHGDEDAAATAMAAHLGQARQGLESPAEGDGTEPFTARED